MFKFARFSSAQHFRVPQNGADRVICSPIYSSLKGEETERVVRLFLEVGK